MRRISSTGTLNQLSIKFCYERIIRLIHLQSNILISDDRKALISDFGLSRLVEATTGYSINSSDTCGSARWMSPEQLPHTSDQPIKLDARNDVWSFGMVVYVRFQVLARFQTTIKCSGLNRNAFQGIFLTANSQKFWPCSLFHVTSFHLNLLIRHHSRKSSGNCA